MNFEDEIGKHFSKISSELNKQKKGPGVMLQLPVKDHCQIARQMLREVELKK